MKKTITFSATLLFLLMMCIGCGNASGNETQTSGTSNIWSWTSSSPNAPERAPVLAVTLAPDQRVQAIQLTTNWSVIYADGTGSGYCSDSPGTLQLSQDAFDGVTIKLVSADNLIDLQFSDDYPPQSFAVQRWYAEYAAGKQDISAVMDKHETIGVKGSSILISDDGRDYVYEVCATWPEGTSYYAFRTTASTK